MVDLGLALDVSNRYLIDAQAGPAVATATALKGKHEGATQLLVAGQSLADAEAASLVSARLLNVSLESGVIALVCWLAMLVVMWRSLVIANAGFTATTKRKSRLDPKWKEPMVIVNLGMLFVMAGALVVAIVDLRQR